ncbi:MAG: hypothetical protein AABW89_03195 [Nanoarchaeota archaeon]
MITTIQLNDNVKRELDRLKENSKNTYEEVIVKMIKQLDEQKKRQRDLLIEGYKEMAEESLNMTKEFEKIEEDFDWEWK